MSADGQRYMNQRTFLGPPRTGFLAGGDRQTHLDHLRRLSQWSRRIIMVSGPFGIGKSSLFRELSNNLESGAKAARLSGTLLTSEREVLVGLLQGLGVAAGAKRHVEDLADTLVEHIAELEKQDRTCIAMVDDAHLLELQAVRRLVQLVSVSGLRLVMFGEASLVRELDRIARIHDLEWFEIPIAGLPRADVRDYLEWRFQQAHYRGLLPFTDSQLEDIVIRSGGNPSVIDSMANRLLGDMESGEMRQRQGGFPVLHAMLAVSLVVMVGLIYLLIQQSPQSTTPSQPPQVVTPAQTTPTQSEAVVPDDKPQDASPEAQIADEALIEALIEPQVAAEALDALADMTEDAGEPLSAEEAALPDLDVEALARDPLVAGSEMQPEMPVSPEAEAELQSGPEAEPDPEPIVADVVEAPVPIVRDEPDPVSLPQRFKDANWLLRQNPEHFTLQMLTLSSRQRATEFIARQENQEEFALYSWERDGNRLFVVTYGVFSGSAAASRTSAGFTGELGRINAWVRPMRLVQDTIRNYRQD